MAKKRQLTKPCSQNKRNKSQSTLEESFSRSQQTPENLEELVNKCVRFVLYRGGNKVPIRRADLHKLVLHNVGKNFQQIVTKATTILKEVYGYDFYLADEQSVNNNYLVSNLLPYREEHDEERDENPEDVHKILIMLILTHIFMSDNITTEASLFAFLRSMEIEVDEKHAVFGNVKEFITVTMVKQKYITMVADEVKRVSYFWGPKAEHEVPKYGLLKFVCKIFKDRTPKSWVIQLQRAKEQNKELGVNEMEGQEENGEEQEE